MFTRIVLLFFNGFKIALMKRVLIFGKGRVDYSVVIKVSVL